MNKSNVSVTVDIVVIRNAPATTEILLVQRKNEPFKHFWALPGGFVDQNEDLEAAAKRELAEETGLIIDNLEQLKAFGKPFRDPRGHTISIAFRGVATMEMIISAGDDAEKARWFNIDQLPDLAFDHAEIISFALSKIPS